MKNQDTVKRKNVILDDLLPEWVPEDKQIRKDLIAVFAGAIKWAEVKSADVVITKAYIKNKYVWLRIERGQLQTDMRVGKFESVKSIKVVDGKIKIKYYTQEELTLLKKLGVGSIGAVSGLVLGLIIGILSML